MPDTLVSPSTGAFQAATPVLELRGSESKSVCEFFKRNCLGLQKFLPPIQSLLLFATRSCGDLSSWHWNPGLGSLVWGWDSLLLRYPSWIFICHMCVWDQPIIVCVPPTSLDGCGFFNSIVVRLPFNLIFDFSEQWLFSILAVILMWLYEKVSHIHLCHHLVQKSWISLISSFENHWKFYGANLWVWKKFTFKMKAYYWCRAEM